MRFRIRLGVIVVRITRWFLPLGRSTRAELFEAARVPLYRNEAEILFPGCLRVPLYEATTGLCDQVQRTLEGGR